MYYHGSFANRKRQTVTVGIVTDGSTTIEREIGENGLYFQADDAVEITAEANDTFDVLLRHSCTIRLLTDRHIDDFFCASCRDAAVNVSVDGVLVFAGFVEPMSYSQPYNSVSDEVELSCIDVLSALQYSLYKGVGSPGVSYDQVRAEAAQVTFTDILGGILTGITADANISGATPALYYDGSKAMSDDSESRYTVFDDISINELLFMGDSEKDVWNEGTVVEELLRYLNLHIVQVGLDFYVFSWESVRNASDIVWKSLLTGATATTEKVTRTVSMESGTGKARSEGTDAQITVGEVYNRLLLTCETKAMESVVESPLDDSLLTSPYTNRQKYTTELSSHGEGEHAFSAFGDMVTGETDIDYDDATITDWYLQVVRNKYWVFPYTQGSIADLYEQYCQNNANQQALPNFLRSHQAGAILKLGKIEGKAKQDDNSVVSKVDMTPYLVVSVNGSDDDDNPYPLDSDIHASIPRAVYIGNTTGGVFSPADSGTTNYIVISGSVVLNPCMWMTGGYPDVWQRWNNGTQLYYWHKTVPSRKNGDGRYYTRKYWKAATPKDTEQVDWQTSFGFCPFTDEGPQKYEFQYSEVGDSHDRISKVSVLQCMLIIGDKCVVETGIQGQPSDFTWQTYKAREDCVDDAEYYAQSFSIGFDPKIGDYIIGQEYDIQNNISFAMGIEASGTAIPIKHSDHVSGAVQFLILGPVNSMWGDVVRKHHTFWHGGSWSDTTVRLMVHTESILLKGFEVKVYSDNGLINNTGDEDLVYMSDTVEDFVNEKDDLSMKLCSLLTTEECERLGVSNGVLLSTPYDIAGDNGVTSIYNALKDETVKPEQDYVDSYYNEYSTPHIILEQTVDGGDADIFGHYTHPALSGRTFHVQGRSLNLMSGDARLTLKEIITDD